MEDEPEKRPRQSGSKKTGGLNPFDISEKGKRDVSNSTQKDAQNSYLESKSGLKQKLVKRTRISLVDNRDQSNNTYSPLKDIAGGSIKGTGSKKLKKGLKFPIQEFISASSDQEEDLIIEKYSQVLRSQEKIIEKKNRDSIASMRGSKNFGKAEENKSYGNGVACNVELRN